MCTTVQTGADHFLDKDENILSWKGHVVHMKMWAVSKTFDTQQRYNIFKREDNNLLSMMFPYDVGRHGLCSGESDYIAKGTRQ